jgi:hypothetical protein
MCGIIAGQIGFGMLSIEYFIQLQIVVVINREGHGYNVLERTQGNH